MLAVPVGSRGTGVTFAIFCLSRPNSFFIGAGSGLKGLKGVGDGGDKLWTTWTAVIPRQARDGAVLSPPSGHVISNSLMATRQLCPPKQPFLQIPLHAHHWLAYCTHQHTRCRAYIWALSSTKCDSCSRASACYPVLLCTPGDTLHQTASTTPSIVPHRYPTAWPPLSEHHTNCCFQRRHGEFEGRQRRHPIILEDIVWSTR